MTIGGWTRGRVTFRLNIGAHSTPLSSMTLNEFVRSTALFAIRRHAVICPREDDAHNVVIAIRSCVSSCYRTEEVTAVRAIRFHQSEHDLG